mgnify:FL=1|tara:strand:+ start:8348 stop:9064 length:717 start_codon:yes stop_codon:yes gene_type:complete
MLLIDDRENEKLKHKLLMKMGDRNQDPKGQAQIKRLPVADYVMGNWGIEAKEINDLYRSIIGSGRNGRTIVNQLQELELAYERPMLVIYNTKLKPWVHGGRPTAKRIAIERQRMEKVIASFKISFFHRFPNIQIMQLKSMDDFVEWLVQNHTQLNVFGKMVPIPVELRGAPNRGDLHPQVAALSALSGVTPETAEKILKKFGGLRNVLRLRTKQKHLMEIEGIGRVKAKLILSLRDGW